MKLGHTHSLTYGQYLLYELHVPSLLYARCVVVEHAVENIKSQC